MITCPHLPLIDDRVRAADSKKLGNDRGEAFYLHRLRYAQSKIADDLPAQAILQLNRAFSSDLQGDEEVLTEWSLPYAAMAWILEQRPDQGGLFLGNPRRHWQHYATRMSGPQSEIRSLRSWACWWLCEGRLSHDNFPIDQEQIDEEGLTLPSIEEIALGLRNLGHPGEVSIWQDILKSG